MSGMDPPIKFINPSKKKSFLVRNTDDLEIESASDVSLSPKAKPKNIQQQGRNQSSHINSKPINNKNTEGLEFLLNAAKQRDDISESEVSDYEDGGDGEYYQDTIPESKGGNFYDEQQTIEERNYDNYNSKQKKKFRKQEMLAKLLALRNKGIELTKNFDMDSSYSEIEFEYFTQKKALDAEASIKFQRQFLVAAVTGLEYLNKRFDPIGAKLNGWSESVISDVDSYDDVFRKLYEKYSSRAELPPEIELMVLLVGSAFMFHMTNSILESAMGGAFNKTVVKQNNNIPTSVSDNISNVMKKTNESEMSGPSFNLSNILGGGIGPPQPISNEPIKYQNEQQFQGQGMNDDRFSLVSSDTQISISKRKNKNNKSRKSAIKTINI